MLGFQRLALALVLALPLAAGAQERPDLPSIKARLQALDGVLAAAATRVKSARPGFRSAYDAVVGLRLTADQARAANQGHLDELPAQAKQVIERAYPAVSAHNAALEAYYSGYDEQASLRMDVKTLETIADLEATRAALAQQGGKVAKLDKVLVDVKAHAAEYWKYRDVDTGKDAHKRLWALRSMSESSRLATLEIDAIERALGIDPTPSVMDRVRAAMGRTKRFWLNLRAKTAVAPPLVKILAYLANPLHKDDPDRVSTLIREMGRAFSTKAKVELDVTGRENIPADRKLIITPSHRSDFVDTMGMVSLLTGRVTPIQTVFFYPKWARPMITRLLAEEPGLILAQAEGVDVVARCVESVKTGRTLLFFPEGNIPSPLGELRRLRSGLEAISEKTLDENVAIVPVTLDDPAESWGVAQYATADRELGMKVRVIFDRPLEPRALFALQGQNAHLLLNTLRESYHRNLLPAMADSAQKFSGEMDGREEQFDALHGAN